MPYAPLNGPSYNTLNDLGRFFSTDEKPVSINEFMKFWDSLSDAEKEAYRLAKLG